MDGLGKEEGLLLSWPEGNTTQEGGTEFLEEKEKKNCPLPREVLLAILSQT